MKLVGMLDSPYVRRVAVSLQLLGLRFEHQSLSLFRTFEAFHQINPVVKAPSFLCDDGTVLMDSSLILTYAEAVAKPRTLMPADLPALQRDLRLIGLALAACEKSVQIIYERALRPLEKQHHPWVQRVTGQLLAAAAGMEAELAERPAPNERSEWRQADVDVAVTWHFMQQTIAAILPAANYPRLEAFSAAAEALPEFKAAPHGEAAYPQR